MKQSKNDFLSQGEIVRPKSPTSLETKARKVLRIRTWRVADVFLRVRIKTSKIQHIFRTAETQVVITCKRKSSEKKWPYYFITISDSDTTSQPESTFHSRSILATSEGSLDEFQFVISKDSLKNASKTRPFLGLWIVLVAIHVNNVVRISAI